VQWRMQDFVNGEASRPLSDEPTEMEINFQICRVAIAVEKLPRRRRRRKNCDASTNQSNNFGVSRKRFKPSTPGSSSQAWDEQRRKRSVDHVDHGSELGQLQHLSLSIKSYTMYNSVCVVTVSYNTDDRTRYSKKVSK